MRANQDLAVAVLNQETGVRGYALTRDAGFLAPYRDGPPRSRAPSPCSATTRRPACGRAGRRSSGRAGLACRIRRAGGAAAGPAPAADPAVGKALFDALRVPMGELTATLDAQRLEARDQLNAAADALRWVGLGIAAVIGAFLAVAAWGCAAAVLGPVAALADQVRGGSSGDVAPGGPAPSGRARSSSSARTSTRCAGTSRTRSTARRRSTSASTSRPSELERSNRDLEQFAYVASHDLQEPLRKVASFCQLLQRRYGGQLDERADQYIAFAVDGAQRMQRLINDLLAFSRIGRSTAAFETSTCGEIAWPPRRSSRPRAGADGEITVGDLPTVQGDEALLRQLLLNLVGNSLKFRRPDVAAGGARRRRTATARMGDRGRRQRHRHRAGVRRQGLRDLPAAARTDAYPGTGIGLALVKKIVEYHGGRIWLDAPPAPSPGTVIRFTLPVRRRRHATGRHRARRRGAVVTQPEVAASTSCWSRTTRATC